MINTVDSFQGQEKDLIIVSTVRSNTRGQIGFMLDERRVNVALTRAKFVLIVVGNADTLGSNETWDTFLRWAEEKNVYYVEESMYSDKFVKQKVDRKRYSTLTVDPRKIRRHDIKANDFAYHKKANK